LIHVERLVLSKCRSDQWLWHRQRCRSGDMSFWSLYEKSYCEYWWTIL